MEKVDKLLAELKELMGKEDEKSEVRRMEIAQWVKEHRCPMWPGTILVKASRGLHSASTAMKCAEKYTL